METLSMLTPAQRAQIEKQLAAHQHDNYAIDIELGPGAMLENFAVEKGVMRPEVMTSVQLARWLYRNQGIYRGKRIIDMGCGSGILGIVAARYGARKATLSDISDAAVANTKKNLLQYSLRGKASAAKGDLFERIGEVVDVIIFNHPFFDGMAASPQHVSASMLGGGMLIHRFLKDAKHYLSHNGRIIMPYFNLAGPANDPALQGPMHGYKVRELYADDVTTGLQRGRIWFYELRR